MKHLLLIVILLTGTGCAEFVTYTMVTAGTLTGRIAHDQYLELTKEKKDDNNSGTERVQER